MSKVEKAIRDLWKEQDIPWTKRHRAGISVPAIVANSSRRNHADRIAALDAWLLIYDEFVSWFVCLDAILLATLNRSRNNRREEAAAYFLLTGAILSQLLAIRCLVLSGFDVSARQVLRSLAEYSDVWQLVAFRPAVAKEFVKTEDEEASNAFWYRHLSKGKTKKFLNALRQIHDSSEARSLAEWRASEEKMLSMAAHPSSKACFAAITAPGAKDDDYRGSWGAKTEASVRTLTYAIIAIVEILPLSKHLLFSGAGRGKPLVRFTKSNILHQRFSKGREVLNGLVGYLVDHQKDADLTQSRSVAHWFADSRNSESPDDKK